MKTPRYTLTAPRLDALAGVQTFNFAVAQENMPRVALAYLAIDATSFGLALVQALEWSRRYNLTHELDVGKSAYPVVRYRDERRIAKRVNGGYVFTEGNGMGWNPVDAVTTTEGR